MGSIEYWRRLKNKNFFPSVLIINAKPFFFPKAWISESYSLGSVVQYASKKDDPFLVIPSQRSIHLSVEIPLEQTFHKTYFNIVKQTIRATTLLCTQTKSYTKDDEIQDSQKISIFDGMRYHFPIKNAGPQMRDFTKRKAVNFEQRLADAKEKVQTHIALEKAGLGSKNSKKKFQFSKMALPHWIPVSCGYFGYSIQSLGCILTSFSTSAGANESRENWNLTLVEYEWNNNEDILEKAEELKADSQNDQSKEFATKMLSQRSENGSKLAMQKMKESQKKVNETIREFSAKNGNNTLVRESHRSHTNFSQQDWMQFFNKHHLGA